MGKPVYGDETASGNRGFEALINSARIDYDRLPMLEVLVDRHVRLLMTELRPRFSDTFNLGAVVN
jgi:flagellar motor switch protein FliM